MRGVWVRGVWVFAVLGICRYVQGEEWWVRGVCGCAQAEGWVDVCLLNGVWLCPH